MQNGKNRVTYAEITALLVGLVVIVIMAVVTTRVRPIPFPFNFAVSLGLGIMVALGVLKVLDPRTETDVERERIKREYRQMLIEMQRIASTVASTSKVSVLVDSKTGKQLEHIALILGVLKERYEQGEPDFSGASKTLLLAKEINRILLHYFEVKTGRQFLEPQARADDIQNTETKTIPMIEQALENYGRQLDAGKTIDKKIAEQTLETLFRALNLMNELGVQLEASPSTYNPELPDGLQRIDPLELPPDTDRQLASEREDAQ